MEGDHQKSLAKLMAQNSSQEKQQTMSATLPTIFTDSDLVPVNNPESASHANDNRYENNIISHNCPDEFPPGYRFCPLDGELIVHYLMKKINKEQLPHDKIKEVNLYQSNPDELSANYEVLGEKEWYFFTPRDRKYPNGSRPNRAAGDGYWKATGADKPVKYKGEHVGYRKALVFYKGKPAKGDKTNWIMHEFRANHPPRNRTNPNDMRLDDWVLCRIYNKVENGKIQVRNEVPKRVSCPPTQNKNENDFAGRNYEYNGIQDSSGQHISSNEGFHPSGFPNVLPQAPHLTYTSFMDLQKFNGKFHQPLPYGGSPRPINVIPPVLSAENTFRPNYFEEDMSNTKTGRFQETIWGSRNLDVSSLLDAANLIDPYLNLDNIASYEPAPDDYIASQTDLDNPLNDSSMLGTD